MRDLQHVGGQIHAPVEQGLLGIALEVAGEQHPKPFRDEPQHDGAVVGVAVRAVPGCGVQHLPAHPAELPDLADRRAHDRDAAGTHPAQQSCALDRGLVQGPDLDGADGPPPQQARHAFDMIGMQVGQHEQRHPTDPQPSQAGVDRARIRSAVDDQRGAGAGADGEAVPLADVAAGQHPAGRRPRRPGQHEHQPGQHRARCPSGADPPKPAASQQQKQGAGQREHQQRTEPALGQRQRGPRLAGPGLGDQDQPVGGQPGQPGGELGRRHADGGGQRGHDAEQRRRGHRRDREQVGRHRQQPHLAGDGDHDGPARQLRGGRDGEGIGQPTGQVAGQPFAPGGGHQQQAGGREGGQREARLRGELGRDEHQDQDRCGQRRQRLPAASGGQREQADPAHHGGPQHAR